MKTDIKSMESTEFEQWISTLGFEPYRARQVRRWLFQKFVGSFEEMTDIPKVLRRTLDERAELSSIRKAQELTSKDGTRKFIFKLRDGYFIESVLIPERDHFTLCISSQVGCQMGCRFCLTGSKGFIRNLSTSEIIDQVFEIKKELEEPSRLTNIVFMGMGEPLLNYDAVLKAIKIMISDSGMNFSKRKVTLSTCGIVPMIKRLGEETEVNLAISLNATDNRERSYLMPINKRYPIEALLKACREYPLSRGRRITFEYLLIKGLNDSERHATKLTRLLKGIKAKVNLIPYNPSPGIDFRSPSEDAILRFQSILIEHNYTAIIRKSKGQDIGAACGQLGSWLNN